MQDSSPIETSESLRNKALVKRSEDEKTTPSPTGERSPLTSLKPVTNNSFPDPSEEPFSMSGQIFEFGFRVQDEAFAVYDLDRSFRSLRFVIGAVDSYNWWSDNYNHTLAVSVDGVVQETDRWKTRPKLKTVTIDLTGAKSLAISVSPGLGIGEPMLEK